MPNLREETIATYNRSATSFVGHFKDRGTRVKDISLALDLAGNPKNARVLEIGCGDGRDAKAINPLVGSYVGMDISSELIKLAKSYVPDAVFEVADVMSFNFPKNLDIIFAFASLLHLDKNEMKLVLDKSAKALRQDGIIYISLKYAEQYRENIQEDDFGRRLFFLYSPDEIVELAGRGFKEVFRDFQTLGKTTWFTLALQKL